MIFPPQPERPAAEAVAGSLRRIIHAIDLHSRRLSRETGLTVPQLSVLQVVQRHPDAPVKSVARSSHLTQATVSIVLDRLEERGLVHRRRADQDRRQVLITITDAGREALARVPDLLQQHFLERFHGLQQWEQSMLVAALQRVADLMEIEMPAPLGVATGADNAAGAARRAQE
jgi:DNA-binding MarR family transcriptional regulator